MDHNQSIEPEGGYENLLYGNMQQSLLDLPIEDLIATTQASLQSRGPQPGGPAAQYPSDGCRTLNRDAVASKAIPETAYQLSMKQSQGVSRPSPCPDTSAIARQAAFYNANASSNYMPNQAAFYDANTGFSSNQRTNSINQFQGMPSVSLPAKRNFAAVDQVRDNPIQGPGTHPRAMSSGNANGNSLLLPVFQSPEKRQCLPISKPKERTQSKESEEGQRNGNNPKKPAVPTPPPNGSSGLCRERTRSSTTDMDSGSGSASTPPTVHSHPPLNLVEHLTNRINPQLRSLINLEHSTRDTPENASSQQTQTTASPRKLESGSMLIRVLRQFLEELKADFAIHQEVIPISCPGMEGDLADVIGRQQCLIGLAFYPKLVSKILGQAKQSQNLHRLAFPSIVLTAIKHAWLCRLKAWWNERKAKLERTFRGELDGFLGSGMPGGVVKDSPQGNSFVYAPGPGES